MQVPPMTDPAAAAAAPGAMAPDLGALAAEGTEQEASLRICIDVDAQGGLSVGMEGAEMKPAGDIKEALTEALRIYKDNQGGAEQDQFRQGFAG